MVLNEFFACPKCHALTAADFYSMGIENCPVCDFEPSEKVIEKRTRSYKSKKERRICPYCYIAKNEIVFCIENIGRREDCGHAFISIEEYELAAELYELWTIKKNSNHLVNLLTSKLFSKNEKEIQAVKNIIEINEIHFKEWLVEWQKVEHPYHDYYDL
jgi:hypothetical protein